MLTARGRAVLGVAAVLLVAGRILGVAELYGLAVAAASVVGLGALRVRAPHLKVAVAAAAVPAVIAVGDPASLELSLENTGTVPTPAGRLRLVPAGQSPGPLVEVPRLVPGEQATVTLRLPSERRGRHEVAGFEAELVDSLGTARRRVTGIGPTRYGIRPAPEPLPGALPSGGGGSDVETTRSSADRLRTGASLLREYQPGDDLRRVHWPTTARVGALMVREGGDRERDASSGITVVTTCYALTHGELSVALARVEQVVTAVASILVAASAEGPFRLVVAGESDTGEAAGARHLDTCLELLTDLRAMPVTSGADVVAHLPRVGFDGCVVIAVVAAADPAEAAAVLGRSPTHFAAGSSGLVLVCCGADTASIEPGDSGELVVKVPLGAALGELWESDLAVGSR